MRTQHRYSLHRPFLRCSTPVASLCHSL
jgi:hypothetical protein